MSALDSENDSVCNEKYVCDSTCCAASSQPFSLADCRSKLGAQSISMEKADIFYLISRSVLFLYSWWNCKKTGIVFDKRWLGIQWFIEDLERTLTRSESGSSSFLNRFVIRCVQTKYEIQRELHFKTDGVVDFVLFLLQDLIPKIEVEKSVWWRRPLPFRKESQQLRMMYFAGAFISGLDRFAFMF